jgi:biopolymer transport protein ExbD
MKRMPHAEVELQVAPMLDMAFQLLTFFILTYRPSPVEGQFAMSLLPAAPAIAMGAAKPSESTEAPADIPSMLQTLPTNLYANPDGTLGRITLNEIELENLDQLRTELKRITSDKSLPFDQTVIYSAPELAYSELIKVIDVFASPEINITKISFAELDESPTAEGPSL